MAITMKSTKQEIMDAYNEAKKRLDEVESVKDDPVAAARAAEEVAIIESADSVAAENIFNPEIIKKYTDLQEATTIKKKELKDLYGIEAKANSMVAMINAYKDKEIDIKEEFRLKKEELERDLANTKELLETEIEQLKVVRTKAIDDIADAEAEKRADVLMDREREEEAYTYNRDRKRRIEEDEWNDKMAKAQAELDAKIADVNEKQAELAEKAEYISDLEEKIDNIPVMLENAKAEGVKQGKADADKSNAFEVRALKKENEYQVGLLQDKCDRLADDLASVKAEKVELQNKLDAAYEQMRDLAARTVESTGGVKILNNAAGTQANK